MFFIIGLYSYSGVRTEQRASSALNTKVGFPLRDIDGDITLLILSCTCRELAVGGHFAYRQLVAAACHKLGGNFLDKIRGIIGDRRLHLYLARYLIRHFYLVNFPKSGIDGGIVHLNNLLAFFAVGFPDGIFDCLDSRVNRDELGDFEEGGLHNHIDSCT